MQDDDTKEGSVDYRILEVAMACDFSLTGPSRLADGTCVCPF